MLTTLCNGQPGIRSAMPVEVQVPPVDQTAAAPDTASPLDHGPSAAVLDFISSTGTLDRYQEIIDPAGWRLDTYRRNPVFQNAHQYGDILFTLGKALITEVRSVSATGAQSREENNRSTIHPQLSSVLFQRIEFATDVNPVARIAYGLYKGGFLNAVSVGFIPVRWEDAEAATNACRRRYLEQELLEVSAVAIPANPEALALAVKSGALEAGDLRETLELLKSLFDSSGRTASNPKPCPQPELLSFARELRRILRRV
jgi:hypothetical protein